jgi:single-strand DNA-binding protein
MQNLNKVILEGNLTRDPELKYTKSGTAQCRFSIAVNDDYAQKKVAYFFNVTAWGKLGETCDKYLKKGGGVIISGKLTWSKYQDKTYTGILADSVLFRGGKKKELSAVEQQDEPWPSAEEVSPPVIDTGEIPF